jgi:hypothetical protein
MIRKTSLPAGKVPYWRGSAKKENGKGIRKEAAGETGEGTDSKKKEGGTGIMKKIAFDEEELLVLAILEPDNRRNTVRQLEMK